jgi:hypothetical protein
MPCHCLVFSEVWHAFSFSVFSRWEPQMKSQILLDMRSSEV